MGKFVITGLPRSRTSWFAAYLTHGDTFCHHEAIYHKKEMNLPEYQNVGNSDSGYPLSPEWAEALGEHKIVVIHRDLDEVANNLEIVGVDDVRPILEEIHYNMDRLYGLHVKFENINEHLEAIHKHIGVPYDQDRAELFTSLDIQPMEFSD